MKRKKYDLTISGISIQQQIKFTHEKQNNNMTRGVDEANKFIKEITNHISHNLDYEPKIEACLLKYDATKENGVKSSAGINLKLSTRILVVALFHKNPSPVQFAHPNLNSINYKNM